MRVTFDINDDILMAGYIATVSAPSMRDQIGDLTFEEFKHQMQKYEVWGVVDKDPVGIVYLDGNSIHISLLEKYHGRCGFIIMKMLKMALDKHGSLMGLVGNEDKKTHKFMNKLGFTKLGQTNDFTFYYRW